MDSLILGRASRSDIRSGLAFRNGNTVIASDEAALFQRLKSGETREITLIPIPEAGLLQQMRNRELRFASRTGLYIVAIDGKVYRADLPEHAVSATPRILRSSDGYARLSGQKISVGPSEPFRRLG